MPGGEYSRWKVKSTYPGHPGKNRGHDFFALLISPDLPEEDTNQLSSTITFISMAYTALTDPFEIQFSSDAAAFKARVVYVKSSENCANFFEVTITHPEAEAVFFLKEKPVLTKEFEYMVWVDAHDRQKAVYQEIGHSIQRHLREKEGIFLMDVAVQNN